MATESNNSDVLDVSSKIQDEQLLHKHKIETEGFIAKIEENTITPEEEGKFIEHLKCCEGCKKLFIAHVKITQFIKKEGYNFLNEKDKEIRDLAKYIVNEMKKNEFPEKDE